jgi:hypothetical protein
VLVARFEITDTGVGIRAKDMTENRLFSAYVQTEIGRHQGGKGTGLGLSLVRQIVLLSGGRLGVKSRVGEGSTFWVEMPFVVGPQTKHADDLFRKLGPADKDLAISSNDSILGSTTSSSRPVPRFLHQPNSSLGSISERQQKNDIELLPTNYLFSSPPASPALPSPTIPGQEGSVFVGVNQNLLRPQAHSALSSNSAPPAVTPSPPPAATPVKPKTQMEFDDGPVSLSRAVSFNALR